ncbi:MAG: FixH family protein [Nitrospirae bacterium]|nr:FixH family protein [Nitrospirota bacterium]
MIRKINIIGVGLLIIQLVFASVGYAKGLHLHKKAGSFIVHFKTEKAPFVGENPVKVEIEDANKNMLVDPKTKIKINYSMPAMPGMPAVSYDTEAGLKDKAYEAKLDLSMSGSWGITVKILMPGKTPVTAKFTMDAR